MIDYGRQTSRIIRLGDRLVGELNDLEHSHHPDRERLEAQIIECRYSLDNLIEGLEECE